jgi:hypothetical protein
VRKDRLRISNFFYSSAATPVSLNTPTKAWLQQTPRRYAA